MSHAGSSKLLAISKYWKLCIMELCCLVQQWVTCLADSECVRCTWDWTYCTISSSETLGQEPASFSIFAGNTSKLMMNCSNAKFCATYALNKHLEGKSQNVSMLNFFLMLVLGYVCEYNFEKKKNLPAWTTDAILHKSNGEFSKWDHRKMIVRWDMINKTTR